MRMHWMVISFGVMLLGADLSSALLAFLGADLSCASPALLSIGSRHAGETNKWALHCEHGVDLLYHSSGGLVSLFIKVFIKHVKCYCCV